MKRIGIGIVGLIFLLTGCIVETEDLCPELNSERTNEELAVNPFSSFSVFGNDIAHLHFADQQSISVEAPAEAIPQISLVVIDNHWEMTNASCESDRLEGVFNLQMTELSSMNCFGNSEIGSPDIMEMNSLNISAGDKGVVTLTGRIKSLILEVSGNARLNLQHFQAETIVIKASGNSRAKIYATNSLEAIVEDTAEVIYQGGPRIYAQVSGEGVLREN